MKKNDLLQWGSTIIRVLEIQSDKVFIIDCRKRNIPTWVLISEIQDYTQISEMDLHKFVPVQLPDMATIDSKSRCIINERYTMISEILPFVSDFRKRNKLLATISAQKHICRQTLINYLCLYLAFQNKAVLAPKTYISDTTLSSDEKNYRWALNKFFYNQNKNSLKTAYTMMLKEKYCDTCGNLLPEYPTFNQFRYFYRKHKNMQNYYISRDGIKKYQRNHRPILGDGVQSYAPIVGFGMLDSTICDIYLINESGNLIGRPILTACIDVYSGLCCGYSLSLEGGVYSLRGLMLNVITDKTEWCKKFGIIIHDGQEIAILNGKEALDLDMLNVAYKQRLSLVHGYIEPSIQKGKSTSNIKSKNTVVPMAQVEIENKISISILAKKSKSEGIDIVPLLKEYFQIVEVTI